MVYFDLKIERGQCVGVASWVGFGNTGGGYRETLACIGRVSYFWCWETANLWGSVLLVLAGGK